MDHSALPSFYHGNTHSNLTTYYYYLILAWIQVKDSYSSLDKEYRLLKARGSLQIGMSKVLLWSSWSLVLKKTYEI